MYGTGGMTDDTPPDPSVSELLKRIVQLEGTAVQLREELSMVGRDLMRAIKVFSQFDDQLINHCKHHDDVLEDVAGRLKNVEYTVFPNLARDIVKLHDVIGGTGESKPNPLDKRDPAPKPKPPKE